MTILTDYSAFGGRHYETGSLHNLLAYNGYDISESLLMIVSGGLALGYFSFAYEGSDPHVALLTRNTFDPFERMTERLGVVQDVQQTGSAARAAANLEEALDSGQPTLVWADMFSLPYTLRRQDDDMWLMIPVTVYGLADNIAFVADRARVPLEIPAADFLAARGVVKKTRYKLLTVIDVNMSRLPSAVEQGLHQTVQLFRGEVPVKRAAKSLGYAGMTRWADCLTKRGDRQSWQKVFPVGPKMYAGLLSTFAALEVNNGPGAERGHFADGLDAAAELLKRPALAEVAAGYRELAPAWTALAAAHLPEDVPLLVETRELLRQESALFIEQGQAAQPQRVQMIQRLRAIRTEMETDFPLDEAEATDLRANLADQVLALRDREQKQIKALEAALAG